MVTVSFFVFPATYMITTPGNLIQLELQTCNAAQVARRNHSVKHQHTLLSYKQSRFQITPLSLPLLVILGMKNYTYTVEKSRELFQH